MTVEDQKKAKILAVLILIAGLTWYFGYRVSPPAEVSTPKETHSSKPNTTASGDNAQIRLDLLEGSIAAGDVGNRNLFQYRPKPVPPPPPPPPVDTSQQQVVRTVDNRPPPPPPPPAFKAFKYESWVRAGSPKDGKLMASLTDGTNTFPNVVVGEVLLGQYRVTRLTETMIEIEELSDLKRRQTFLKV